MTHKIEYTLDSFTRELGEAGTALETAPVQFGEIRAVAVTAV